MIRHVHNTNTQNVVPSNKATRPATITDSDSDSFRKLFDSSASQPVTINATVTKTPTAATKPVVTLTPPQYQQGATVTNPDGSITPVNVTEFAAPATAQQIAAKLGGTVATTTLSGYSAGQLNISVPGSPNMVNAGIAADLFARYGDQQGSQAWQIINRDLGRDPMST